MALASTASRPATVTIMIRPSVGRDGRSYKVDFSKVRSGIFFGMGVDLDVNEKRFDLPVGQLEDKGDLRSGSILGLVIGYSIFHGVFR
jgi:hypothetical protein